MLTLQNNHKESQRQRRTGGWSPLTMAIINRCTEGHQDVKKEFHDTMTIQESSFIIESKAV